MRQTMVFCDNPACKAKTEPDNPAWWVLILHRRQDATKDGSPQDLIPAPDNWTIRDLCPECGAKFEQGMSGGVSIVFRKQRVKG